MPRDPDITRFQNDLACLEEHAPVDLVFLGNEENDVVRAAEAITAECEDPRWVKAVVWTGSVMLEGARIYGKFMTGSHYFDRRPQGVAH